MAELITVTFVTDDRDSQRDNQNNWTGDKNRSMGSFSEIPELAGDAPGRSKSPSLSAIDCEGAGLEGRLRACPHSASPTFSGTRS